jgi:2-keto-3-deoxy-L-rhamnonate aldolase RhmA
MTAHLKQRLATGEYAFGSFAFLPSPDVVEIMGLAGFDYVIIDLEHSPKNWETVANMVRAAELHGMAPLIRIRENGEKTILEALELGAAGVVVPFLHTDPRRALRRTARRVHSTHIAAERPTATGGADRGPAGS